MDQTIGKFIDKERVGVISINLSSGEPHSATIHYSHQEKPLKFYIQTSNKTKKVQDLLNGEIRKASMVIGFSEQNWLTLQMRGEVVVINDQHELEKIYSIHYKKHPDAEQYKGPNTIFLEFTHTWLRFTDFNTDPEIIIEQ